jgi:hypothetical protein
MLGAEGISDFAWRLKTEVAGEWLRVLIVTMLPGIDRLSAQ